MMDGGRVVQRCKVLTKVAESPYYKPRLGQLWLSCTSAVYLERELVEWVQVAHLLPAVAHLSHDDLAQIFLNSYHAHFPARPTSFEYGEDPLAVALS